MTQPSLIQELPANSKKMGVSTGKSKAKKRGLMIPLGVAGAGVVVLGLVVVAVTGWSKGGARADDILRATASQRNFTVNLKEKGELKASKSTDIKCEVEGRSTIISLIPEGTPVKEGDLLVTLASDQIENRIREEELKEANAITAFESAKTELDIQRDKNASDIRKANLQIELKQLDLDKYDKGEWSQKLKDAQIAIEQARIALERRDQDYTASKELFSKKYTTQTEYQEAEFNFKKAEWDLEKANKSLDVLQTYTRVAELRQKESDLEEATKEADRVRKNADAEEIKKVRAVEGKEKELALIQEQLSKFRSQKEKCRIVAPTQGFVVYYTGGGGGRFMMGSEGQIKEGAEVIERQVLMQLPDTTSMMAVVRVHEAKTDKLRLGQQAFVNVEGIPGRQFSGKVTKIAALADSQSGWLNPDLKEYETEITLDPVEISLKPGVTSHAEILVNNVEDALAVPVQAIYSKGGKRYVFRDDSGEVKHVEVGLGNIGTEWAEVTTGLSSGDKVLLSFADEHRRQIPDAGPGERGAGGPQQMRGRGGPRVGGQRQGPGGKAPGLAETSPGAVKVENAATLPTDAKPVVKTEALPASAAASKPSETTKTP